MRNIKDNNYVAIGQHICPVCCETFDSGEILIHKHLRNIPDDKRVTDVSLCPKDKEKYDEGYAALIEVTKVPRDRSELFMHRTGRIAYVKRHVLKHLTNLSDKDIAKPFIFTDIEFLNYLEKLQTKSEQE